MIYTQTEAENLVKKAHITTGYLPAIAKYSCCALTALRIMHIEPSVIGDIEILCDEMTAGSLDNECTISWKKFFKDVSGRDIEVTFLNISSLKELDQNKQIKKSMFHRVAVKYQAGNAKHWVCYDTDTKEIINSLINSIAVTKGKPVEARIIELAK